MEINGTIKKNSFDKTIKRRLQTILQIRIKQNQKKANKITCFYVFSF